MPRKVLEKCPSCGGEMEITRLNCTTCETIVTSRYSPCRFCKLSPDHLEFLLAFVKSRGNVKEMERELGISYWTIRNKLNDLVKALGFEVDPVPEEDTRERRRDILDQVSRGELSATDAAERLVQLKT